MHGDDVQVRHRRTHDDVRIGVPSVQPLDDLEHEVRDLVGRRGLEDDAPASVDHRDGGGAPQPRILIELE